ncbi:calcium/sodium antiporter [Hirschia litorea]|uniref:Calcium/sodium antiporter n=1 Tax=Hirschia litorea TaxID=1199156 RepID=A0ABW2IKP9_9PROT
MIYVFLLSGLILLVAGGEVLVRGAVSIAQTFKVSPLVIGLTLVGFGTSTPELVTSLQAAFAGAPGIAVGNVVGSNIANILFILGLSALIFPVAVASSSFRRDGLVLSAATLLCVGVIFLGALTRWMGVVLVAGLIAYIAYAFLKERSPATANAAELPDESSKPNSLLLNAVFVVAGLVMTIFGARFLVMSATDIATSFGVSETIIGLTIVAVGTSLPELVTSLMAALRKQGDLAFGNIVGSNIYNILGILGVTAIVKPIPIPPQIASFDVWVLLGATLLLIIAAITHWKVTRLEGGIMLAGYVAYIAMLVGFAV